MGRVAANTQDTLLLMLSMSTKKCCGWSVFLWGKEIENYCYDMVIAIAA